ncbi:hypothetical protein NUW58_g8834 [Xylaria curta]|uniref:Uncharacterized protein n=1 Tax=Xylaria curta TaxID=42375 RepID=A0ACC1N5E7_9PEZI|nr:hypothetical protein NUW58_g8834 [Xylaria curta]
MASSAPPPVTSRRSPGSPRDAAAFAAQQRFAYLWVDTCYIDKTTSAELPEAIDSAYKWYVDSAECHPFVEDIPLAAEENLLFTDLLARLPSNFKYGVGIETLPITSTTANITVELTSHGVQVQLHLRQQWQDKQAYGDEDYHAILDCAIRIGGMDYCPAIWPRHLG